MQFFSHGSSGLRIGASQICLQAPRLKSESSAAPPRRASGPSRPGRGWRNRAADGRRPGTLRRRWRGRSSSRRSDGTPGWSGRVETQAVGGDGVADRVRAAVAVGLVEEMDLAVEDARARRAEAVGLAGLLGMQFACLGPVPQVPAFGNADRPPRAARSPGPVPGRMVAAKNTSGSVRRSESRSGPSRMDARGGWCPPIS